MVGFGYNNTPTELVPSVGCIIRMWKTMSRTQLLVYTDMNMAQGNDKEIDDVLFQNPKSFVSGTRIYVAKEFFALRIDVGTQQFNFALPPMVAKSLGHFLTLQIENYEIQVRPIPFNVDLPSPLSMNDLKISDGDEMGQSDSKSPPSSDNSGKPKKPKKK